MQNSGKTCRENADSRRRHCERKRPVCARCASFAGQRSAEAPLREGGSNAEARGRLWIASSLTLLAMTSALFEI